MAAVENHLGFKTDTLHVKTAPGCVAGLFLAASFVVIFFKWRLGLPLFLFSIAFLRFVEKRGNEMGSITMGEWAKRIARENYRKARRHPGTINKNEIEGVIKAIFCHEPGLPESAFTAETKLP